MKNDLARSTMDSDGTVWFIQRGGARQRAKRACCNTCGNDYWTYPSGKSRFCSPDCWRKQCKGCGESFKPRTPRQVYCSDACKRGTALCWECGKEFVVGKKAEGKFCSLGCFYNHQCPVGTRTSDGSGYILVKVPPGTPNAKKRGTGINWMLEHRFVMQQVLGRALAPNENVHHKNGKREDNRPDNLELWKRSQPAGVRASDYHCPGCRCSET